MGATRFLSDRGPAGAWAISAAFAVFAGATLPAFAAARAGDWWEPPAGVAPFSDQRLREEGCWGFPQRQARVLCDVTGWRLSCWSDARTFYVQAVIWEDGDDSFGVDAQGRETGDTSTLSFARADAKARTPGTDRDYHLDPWPLQPGVHFVRVLSEDATTPLSQETGARGAIRYLRLEDNRVVRVDSFAVPLEEIGQRPGGQCRLLFTWRSAVPERVGYATARPIPTPRHPAEVAVTDYSLVQLFPAAGNGSPPSPVPSVNLPDGRADRFLILPAP